MTPLFNYNRKEPRERLWALAFVLTWLASLGFGMYAAVNSNLATDLGPGRRLLSLSEEPDSPGAFLAAVLFSHPLFLLFSLAGGLLLGWLLLRLVDRHALILTRVAVGLMAANCILLGVICLFGLAAAPAPADKAAAGVYLALVCVLLVLMWLGRKRIQQAGQLLGVAARALRENLALVAFLVVLSLVSCLAVGPPLVMGFMAAADGKVLVLPFSALAPAGAWCTITDVQSGQQTCFVPTWRYGGTVLLLALSTLWTLGLLAQLLVFVTSGVLGQWHISDGHSSSPSSPAVEGHSAGQQGASVWQQSKRRLWVTLGHALSPSCSLGSLALCSFPLAAPAIFMGQALARAPEEVAQHGFARGALLHTPARVLRGWLVCGSGAATVLMSWSGNSYVDSAEAAAALVTWCRFVVVFFAVWLNSLTLHAASQLLAAAFGALLGFVFVFIIATSVQAAGTTDAAVFAMVFAMLPLYAGVMSSAYVMAAISGLLIRIALAVVVVWLGEQDESAGKGGAGNRAYQPVAAAPGAAPPKAPLSSELDELLAPLMESDGGKGKAAGEGEEGDVEFGRLRQGGRASYVGPDGQEL